ncbi:MAG: DUF2334 domain-containing protein [Bdellovibrionaceae bacterium]|nr:DUF2334 domain-containing protein [Pseudobdellovibrionaceae bacterium]
MKLSALFLATSFSAVLLASALVASPPSRKCVNIYYDQSKDSSYWMGRTYSIFVQNLMGHFPEFQQIVSPVESYRSGQIDQCAATIYIGSYFDNPLPREFLEDFQKTSTQVAWLGYNIWQLPPEAQERTFGFRYLHLSTLDKENLTASGEPTFFKDVLYKGETFWKYGKFSKGPSPEFVSAFEMSLVELSEESFETQIIASARHNGTKEEAPYILRKENRFYVADVPFTFMHEADRYLVFADVLFDILKEKPRHDGKYAFLRIEDIHPLVPISYLYSVTNTLTKHQVPINISLIPIFFDPRGEFSRDNSQEFVTMTQVPEFMQFIKESLDQNANMIWHGSTHQYLRQKNPHSGVSGDDFEFWDAINGRPLAEDSSEFVLDRLDAGFYDLEKAGIYPEIWLTPHYQASPLDYFIFARVFPWNVGRAIYFNHTVKAPAPLSPRALWYDKKNANEAAQKRRSDYFKQFEVSIESDKWSGQMFPYEIYGDVYGQRLIPENLGNSQPTENNHVVQPRSVREMIADAKRNLVLRDAWASFFYHAQLLNTDADGGRGRYPGDPAELEYLLVELKKLGYQFIDIKKFIQQNEQTIRPEPIYLSGDK